MEAFYVTLLCLFLSFVYLSLRFLFSRRQLSDVSSSSHVLPPGKTGWPLVGETFEFLSTRRKGQPEKFFEDRMNNYSRDVFKTHLAGETTAILCGAAGNKFLYTNENKLVQAWWPRSVDKILGYSQGSSGTEGTNLRRLLPNFIKPEGLMGYIGIMDEIAQKHFAEKWENHEQVVVLPLTKDYTFSLACKLFFSIEDRRRVQDLADSFTVIIHGLFSIPIDLPGTHLNKATKAGNYVRKEIISIIRQRKIDLEQGKASPTQDILSHMLTVGLGENENENGYSESEHSIAARIIGLLIAGYDSASVTCAFIVKYLAELPEIYDAVRREQIEVTASKAPGELLNWEDLQKMKYSWNVACEVLRLAPPGPGGFREAIVDFTYKGFSIPKGWKLHWSVYCTHKNPEFFPDPEKFDPLRFEGYGPIPYTFVPFGGGPRMCPGKEYARLEILVFMHHLVKKFKWEKIIPDERMVLHPSPIPEKGLPIRLFPYKA